MTIGVADGAGLGSPVMMELRKTFQHPPLELLFTTDEEPDLFNAMALRDSGEELMDECLTALGGGRELVSELSGGVEVVEDVVESRSREQHVGAGATVYEKLHNLEEAIGDGIEGDVVNDDNARPPESQQRRGHAELLIASPDRDREFQVVVDFSQLLVKPLDQCFLLSSFLRKAIQRANLLYCSFHRPVFPMSP